MAQWTYPYPIIDRAPRSTRQMDAIFFLT